MEKTDFVTTDIGIKLKELEFHAPCIMGIDEKSGKEISILPADALDWNGTNNRYSLPTWQQVFDWFRDKHCLEGHPQKSSVNDHWSYKIYRTNCVGKIKIIHQTNYPNFDHARCLCVQRMIIVIS